MAASGDGTFSASAAAWLSPAQRKPRKRFRIDEDLCLLKEVVCTDPFSNPAAWEDVLRNVMRAINRELTIRGIKERVDLLIGYFRQQDTVNLRKSGTEEQYGEREQLLQDVSDLMREVDYAPRTVPRKANGMGLSKKNGVGPRQPTQQLASSKARRAQALLIRDAAMASLPAVRASDDGQKNDEATATNMLLAIYEDELSQQATEPQPAQLERCRLLHQACRLLHQESEASRPLDCSCF
nr:uncharacterized protein LOC119178060 [Rhipicephalus microplus]